VTASFSLFAYIWMLIVLNYWTEGYVTYIEAVLTLLFFFLLIGCAFVADRVNSLRMAKQMSKTQLLKVQKQQQGLHAKDEIIRMVEDKGMTKAQVLESVYGKGALRQTPRNHEIQALFKTALGVDDLQEMDLAELNRVFEADSEIQQIRYKRAFGRVLGAKRDFVIMKGQVGQNEHVLENQHQLIMNEEIGFKCLHYSVSESSEKISISVENKTNKV